MTQGEKARAYDEALKDMRVIYPNLSGDAKLAVEHAFPQLTESEDERLKKLLVWQVHRNIEDETNDLARSVYDGIKGHHPDLEESIEDWKKCLAWLERQKENTWSEEDDAKVKAMCKEGDLKPTERAWLKNLRNRVWKEPQHAIRVTKGFGDPDGPQFELVDLQEDQKPTEWNDSDMKEARNNLISVCRDWERGEKTTLLPVVAVRARYFLEHLTEPKCAVLSKEDENKIERLAFLVSVAEEKEMISPSESIDLRNFIKSLRPQQKQEWSENGEKILDSLIRLYGGEYSAKAWPWADGVITYGDVVNFLKSLRPSWKPSEEQMKALKEAYESYDFCDGERGALESLYNYIKKL